jgi:hypothetical protein
MVSNATSLSGFVAKITWLWLFNRLLIHFFPLDGFYFSDIMVEYLRPFRCLAKHQYAPSLYGDMLLSHILTVTFEWFVLKEIFFAQK